MSMSKADIKTVIIAAMKPLAQEVDTLRDVMGNNGGGYGTSEGLGITIDGIAEGIAEAVSSGGPTEVNYDDTSGTTVEHFLDRMAVVQLYNELGTLQVIDGVLIILVQDENGFTLTGGLPGMIVYA